jgi:hypothetical protein
LGWRSAPAFDAARWAPLDVGPAGVTRWARVVFAEK